MLQVAHDLRNFHAVILGYCELGAAGKKPSDYCFARIREAAQACGDLLDRGFGLPQKSDQALNVNEVIMLLWQAMEPLLANDIRIALEPDESPAATRGDAMTLYRALLNIAKNAAEAIRNTRMDGGQITIKSQRDEQRLLLTIADNGGGMNADIARAIESGNLTPPSGAHGHGLHIIRQAIVEMLGGAIAVETEPGIGTTFKIWLPLAA